MKAAIGRHPTLSGEQRRMIERVCLDGDGAPVELTENHRQLHAWEPAALEHIREGRPERALPSYQAYGRLMIDDTPAGSRARLVEDWSFEA